MKFTTCKRYVFVIRLRVSIWIPISILKYNLFFSYNPVVLLNFPRFLQRKSQYLFIKIANKIIYCLYCIKTTLILPWGRGTRKEFYTTHTRRWRQRFELWAPVERMKRPIWINDAAGCFLNELSINLRHILFKRFSRKIVLLKHGRKTFK